ncbi:hypothetical protein GGR52DRAFT_554918 [Hypoxylon sp. FL1284]|nr:hypothetical protein GGR52DRAFT_554918 [Hypoxylon sp. FL1284]
MAALAYMGMQYMPSTGDCMLDMAAAPANIFDVCGAIHIRMPEAQHNIDVQPGMICIKPTQPANPILAPYRERYMYPQLVANPPLRQRHPAPHAIRTFKLAMEHAHLLVVVDGAAAAAQQPADEPTDAVVQVQPEPHDAEQVEVQREVVRVHGRDGRHVHAEVRGVAVRGRRAVGARRGRGRGGLLG